MKTRKIGGSGLEVAPLAFGGNVFGWTIDEATSFKLLDAFVAAGFNLVDTADMYSRWVSGNHGGESETIIGKWFKQTGKRDKVVLATKVGMEMGPDKKGLSRAYIFKAVEDSLRRLQTDRIDLYQSHKDDPDTPLEETLAAYDTLIQQGKVRAHAERHQRRHQREEAQRQGGAAAAAGGQPDVAAQQCGEGAHSFRLSLERPSGSWVAAMMMPPAPQWRAISCATSPCPAVSSAAKGSSSSQSGRREATSRANARRRR